MFAPGYGPGPIRALTRASAPFYQAPPDGFGGQLLTPRDVVMIAREDQVATLDALIAELRGEMDVSRLDGAALDAQMPLLRRGYAAAGLLDGTGSDIDVHALHQGYLRAFREAGGRLLCKADVRALASEDGGWRIDTGQGDFVARIVVNAAGAWADEVGRMAGAERIGLVPKRRTAMVIAAPDGAGVDRWPLVVDIDEKFYLKPDAGRLLISPANEDPTDPCDVQPEEMDIALCIDRIERAFDLGVGRLEARWAGLRSFVPDKCPVVGFSARADGFFWLAGQGGYGIQTAPALSRLAAALLRSEEVPEDIAEESVLLSSLSPERLDIG